MGTMNNIIKILRQLIAEVNNSLKKTKQELTPEQQARVRENIGILLGNYDQNDPTAADHIKNRPFYEDESGIHHIDEKFIPESIARTSDISDSVLTTEEWNTLNTSLNNESEAITNE